MIRRWHHLLLLFAASLCLGTPPARADSWQPASRQTILSPHKSARVTIMPREIEGALEFFKDKVRKVEPAGAIPGDHAKSASARVEVLRGTAWVKLWHGPLVNDVSPVTAFLSDDGMRLLTLDNWHMMGAGDDVIAIYNEHGRAIMQLSLAAIFGKEFVDALPRSVSSIHWRLDPRWRGGQFVIPVLAPAPNAFSAQNPATFDLLIDAATGRIVPPAEDVLERGRAVGRKAAADEAAYRAERAAWHRAPLLPPANPYDERAWGEYLDEPFLRLDDRWRSEVAWDVVLRPRTAKDYPTSVEWVHDALGDRTFSSQIYGSPDSGNLAALLTRELLALKPGARKDLRLYVVNDGTAWDALAAAAHRAGAEAVRIDPAIAISQRPERLAKPDYELLDSLKVLEADDT